MAKKHKIEAIPKQNANWSITLDNLTKGFDVERGNSLTVTLADALLIKLTV